MIKISREKIKNAKRIIVKVGTSTLTYDTGRLNLQRIETLARVLSDISNSGKDVALVSSGAVAAGLAKLGFSERPKTIREKQATAAVGQGALMNIYEKLFAEYNHVIAQILLTRTVVENDSLRFNAINTFETLFSNAVIPIVNENDTIATEEFGFGENDTLSAIVSKLVGADLLIILSDIDGLYTADPRENKDAKLIGEVNELNDSIMNLAGGAGTTRGTGGMVTKLEAAKICFDADVDLVIANGKDPYIIREIIEGKNIGTLFSNK